MAAQVLLLVLLLVGLLLVVVYWPLNKGACWVVPLSVWQLSYVMKNIGSAWVLCCEGD